MDLVHRQDAWRVAPPGVPHPEQRGFSTIELMVTVFVLGILVALVAKVGQIRFEAEQAHNAQLKMLDLCEAEKRYYAYKATFTDDFAALAIADPSAQDSHYRYQIVADDNNFTISALKRRGGAEFRVDKNGCACGSDKGPTGCITSI